MSNETKPKTENAVLIGIDYKNTETKYSIDEYLNELQFLVETAGAITVKRFTQKLLYPHPRTFIGEGKLEEIKLYVLDNNIDMVVFDEELTPSQIRNIEVELKDIKILDRSNLILDIFAKNAKSAQAKIQVELAQCQYLLPRLTRMWTHLSKQKGGIGMKGPGEKEIETDRRIIRNKIDILKEKLNQIERQSDTQRQGRNDKHRVALIGYTNVGKSTIMNLLSNADVLAENKLFATLDSTVRKITIEYPKESGYYYPILLSDTVGFIRKLPTMLIESFKSTLAEVKEADLLIHVVDISHVQFEEQIAVVKNTLEQINAHLKPQLIVFNKIDLFKSSDDEDKKWTLEEFKKSWIAKENTPVVFISASQKNNIDQLKQKIAESLVKQ